MKRGKIVGLAAMTLTIVAPSAVFGTYAPAAAESTSQVLSGVVLTSDGAPAPGAEVHVDALTNGASVQDLVPVGSAVADERGRFTISGMPADPATVSDGGEVYLQVRGASTEESVVTGLTAVLPTSEGAPWTLPEAADGNLADAALTLHNAATGASADHPLTLGGSPGSGGAVAATTVADDTEAVDGTEGFTEVGSGEPVQRPQGVEVPMPVTMPAAAGACPSAYNAQWLKTTALRYSYVPIQFGRTRGKSTMTYSYDITNNTDLEITYTKDGEGWSGGLGASADEKENRNYTYTFQNSVRKMLKLEWEYVRWDQYCISQGPAMYFKTGTSKWVPNKIASGSRAPDTSSDFTCDTAYVSDFVATTTVARESALRWNGWFSIAAGFKADVRQENTTSEKMTLTPDVGQTAKICGSNAKPLVANKVKEVL